MTECRARAGGMQFVAGFIVAFATLMSRHLIRKQDQNRILVDGPSEERTLLRSL